MSFLPAPDDRSQSDSWVELADAWAAASIKHGFATPRRSYPTARQRRRRVSLQAHAALDLVSQLQHHLLDQDATVRASARQATLQVMHCCYTGDQSDRAWRSETRPYLADKIVAKHLRTPDPDGPEPNWAQPPQQRRTRLRLIVAALVTATAGAALIATHLAIIALPFLVLAGLLDIADGAYARAVGMRDAEMRWLSCIASHASDMFVFGAVTFAAFEFGRPGLALLVLAGSLASLFGSLVRVSALQAGYRFWRSRNERIVRYLTMAAYCILATLHTEPAATIVIAAALTVFGVGEVIRVVRGVLTMPAVREAGVMFIDRDDEVQWWGLIDEDNEHRRTPAQPSRSPVARLLSR